MADIFISYARSDRDKIEKLAAALTSEGWSVWWDRHIAGGAEFSKDIERELGAADAVIVAWSKESTQSRWVKDEAGIAAEGAKLVAISLDGAPPPIGFKQFHAIDYTVAKDAAAFADLKRSVALKLGREQPAENAPAQPDQKPNTASARNKVLFFAAGFLLLSVGAIYLFYATLLSQRPVSEQRQASDADEILAPEAAARTDGYTSIAVLAFSDLSPEKDQEYFSDGIAEELLNVLARETDLRVAARTSSFAFKGKNESIRAIASALNVETVLEGSVRKTGDKVRVTAQLIDAASGFHLWSETYDRELKDVFAVQDEIAGAIVRSIPAAGGQNQEPSVTKATSEAYDLFLQGRHQLARRTRTSIEQAQILLEQSVAADPSYAPAWADLALSVLLLHNGPGTYGDLTVEETTAIAAPAIENALARDPALGEAFVARGLLHSHQGDTAGAIAAYRKAIELNPSVSNARHLLYLALLTTGAYTEAFEVIDRAVELDPLSAITLENYVQSLIIRGRFEQALAAANRLYSLHPGWPLAVATVSRSHAANGQFAEAASHILDAVAASRDSFFNQEAAFALLTIKHFDHPLLQNAPPEPKSFSDIMQNRPEEARRTVMDYYRANPQSLSALWRTVWSLWTIGDPEAALALADDFAKQQTQDETIWVMAPVSCYPGLYIAGLRQRHRDPATANRIVTACRQKLDAAAAQDIVLPYYERDMVAELLVLEGRHDEAIAVLRELADTGLMASWWIGVEPIYAPLREDPRFQAIVADFNAIADREREEFLRLTGSTAE